MSEYFNLNEGVKKVEKKLPKFNLKFNKKLILPALILAAIPLTIGLALAQQELRSRASEQVVNRVFVTSANYDGNLGGLEGADAICQTTADGAGLGGVWKAWLSDSTTPAASRMIHSVNPYKLLNGTTIANNWTDLTDGSVMAPVNITEQGIPAARPFLTWTNTKSNGEIQDPPAPGLYQSCNNWTSNASNVTTIRGATGSTSGKSTWTSNFSSQACGVQIKLYCIEQVQSASPTPTEVPTPTPSPTPDPRRSEPVEPISVTEHSLTVSNYTPSVSINPGEDIEILTLINTSESMNQYGFFGYPTSFGPGINYRQQSGGLLANGMSKIEIEVNSDVPAGIYKGIPQLMFSSVPTRVSLPELTVYVGLPLPEDLSPSPTEEPTPTSTPTLTPTPTITPTPSQAILKMVINPTADAYVRSSAPTKNFGLQPNIRTGNSPIEVGYIKFNLSQLAGKTIKKATLRIKVNDPSSQTQSLKRGSTAGWNEAIITYNNRPGFDSTIRSFSASANGQVLDLSVTNAVNLRKGKEVTFGITSGGSDLATFYSKEATTIGNRPQLIVEYQ
jgi:hypothetical protein